MPELAAAAGAGAVVPAAGAVPPVAVAVVVLQRLALLTLAA